MYPRRWKDKQHRKQLGVGYHEMIWIWHMLKQDVCDHPRDFSAANEEKAHKSMF